MTNNIIGINDLDLGIILRNENEKLKLYKIGMIYKDRIISGPYKNRKINTFNQLTIDLLQSEAYESKRTIEFLSIINNKDLINNAKNYSSDEMTSFYRAIATYVIYYMSNDFKLTPTNKPEIKSVETIRNGKDLDIVQFMHTLIKKQIPDLVNEALNTLKNSPIIYDINEKAEKILNNLDENFNTLESRLPKITKTNTDKQFNLDTILKTIKKRIVCQDEGIDIIIPAILNNQKVISTNNKALINSQKSNILVVGPTGIGKTQILKEFASITDIPLVEGSATNYSGVGYVDDSLNSLLVDLLLRTKGNDLQEAEKGIVYLDEIDKLGESSLEMRKAVMQELLTWLSGTKIRLKVNGENVLFDTSNLTFVFSGAFEETYATLEKRNIGFDSKPTTLKTEFDIEEAVKNGMNRQLLGRIDVIATLNSLRDVLSLSKILCYSEYSPLSTLIDLFKIYNVNLSIDESVITEIALRASKQKTGARALKKEVSDLRSKFLLQLMKGNIPENFTLTKEMLNDDYSFENQKLIKTNI